MISISRLLCDMAGPGDSLRYGKRIEHSSEEKGFVDIPHPVVVWNCTRQCNLQCIHCYASANSQQFPGEMDTAAAERFIRDLANFGIPAILFSGGEPLLRKDLLPLAGLASGLGIRTTLSTNGVLIDRKVAREISSAGFAEVGLSLDGSGTNNDRFRGQNGAFDKTLTGIRNCVSFGLRVSLRLTITRFNYHEIPSIFQLVEKESIDRVCFYHLAYSGRGHKLQQDDVTHLQTRAVLDTICEHTLDLYRRGFKKEILTVGNHADGVYLYLKLKKTDSERANRVVDLLRINGGNNSGIRICAVDDAGNVHPDQFWWHYTLGNVCQRKFSDIWTDTSEPLLHKLRNRKELLKGRCSRCWYLDLCNGNLRVRAEAVYGDVWAEDPACYLSDQELGILNGW